MQYSPGSNVELEATFTTSTGTLVDPAQILVDIYDSDGLQVVSDGIPTQLSLGTYQYVHPLPQDAPVGLWRAEWQAVVNGLNTFGEEIFDVQFSDVIVQPSESIFHARLRSRLGEVSRLPEDQAGSDTMFSTNDISDLISYAGGDLDVATLEGWKRKAATLARLIDVSESGSDRQLSQRFRQARDMLRFWEGFVSETEALRLAALGGRVVGRVVNLGRIEDPMPGTPFSGYSEHIRMYPTKRLLIPAILG